MPRHTGEKDSRVIENVHCTFARELVAGVDRSELAGRAMAKQAVDASEKALPPHNSYFNRKELFQRWSLLKDQARVQSFEVMNAMHTYLAETGMDPDSIADQIRGSWSIGRQFGKLSSVSRGVEEDQTYDEGAIVCMKTSPGQWFSIDTPTGQIDFSEASKTVLHNSYKKHVGCPALTASVTHEDDKVNVFDAYWELFAQNYAQVYVVEKQPYTRLTISAQDLS